MEGQIITAEGVIKVNKQARASALAHNEAIKAQTFSAKAGKVAFQALATAGNMIVMWGVSKIVSGLYDLSQVSKTVANNAKELGDTFNGTSSDIDNYKSKIEESYSTIKDSNSSIEDVTNARKSLLSVQDELIKKFGTEKSVIEDVTDAVNGQIGALDHLTNAKWQEAKNNFNDGGFWNGVSNFLGGYSNNIDRMVAEYGDYKARIRLNDFINPDSEDQLDEFKELLENRFDAKITFDASDGNSEIATLSGNASEIYEKLLNIQNLTDQFHFSDSFENSLTKLANSAQEVSNKYKEFYNQYILYEKILNKDSNYADIFKNITDAYDEYQKAFTSGDEEKIKEATDEYAKILTDATSIAIANNDSDIASYFENMYPTLNSVVDGWKFNVDFEANTNNLQGKVQSVLNELKDENGRSLTSEEILGLNTENNQYKELDSIANSYNMTLEEMIELLKERNLVSAMDYQGLVRLFGQENVAKLSSDDLKIAYTIENVGNITFEQLQAEIQKVKDSTNKAPISFSDALIKSEDIQSSISTLRSALDSFNQGTLDESAVLDLMQQFPALIPYIDLAADGFGNLSEGLSTLIAQQPESLIQDLQTLKASLNMDEERDQVDALINSLQTLSSYGDTGMEAYVTTVGSTWGDTENVIKSVTTQFENLAKVQEAVANGLTMSTTAAAELAKMYPEILTNAEVSANGQITLNEDVVSGILDGDKSIIDAQIAKLEADKAELTAKKSYAEAQLNIIKQVAEGEGGITKEVAQYRIDAANELLHALIEAGLEEDRAYAAVTANMAGNTDEFNRIAGEVAEDISVNMDDAAVSMANSININSINAQNSFKAMQIAVWELSKSIKGMADGAITGGAITSIGGGSTSTGGIKARKHSGNFNTAITDYTPQNINLEDFQSQLEIDIQGYTDAISNIDSQIEILKNLQASFENNGGIGGHGYKDKIKALEKEKDILNGAEKGSAGAAKETEYTYEKLFNFFERRTKVLQDSFENLEKGMDNVFGADAKNALVTAQLGIVDEEINNYADALAMYRQKANEALSGMDSDLRDKIVNGAVQLTDFVGKGKEEVVEAMEAYKGWADKVADCTQKLEELKTQIRQLELQKFNNIMEEFQNQFDLRDDSIDLIKKQIGLLEEAGELVGESFYSKQIEQSQKKLDLLESEKVRLVQQLNNAISSGRIQHGTDEWLEMQNSLSDVEGNILDCKTAMEELNNELLNLNLEIFERVQTEFGNISSELGNLADLFDEFNTIQVSDGKGDWTDQAIATLGLYAQQFELAEYQVGQYGNAIENLNKDYLTGKYSATEYMEKLADLSKGQWDAVKSAESLEDAIVDLNKTRVEEEIHVIEEAMDAYKEYTDAQIEALDAAKDLHDYQKEIADKTKAVSDLERQIAAMQNDSSAATIAKRKKLEEQLAEAKNSLEETEYQHSIEVQKDALNKNLEDFQEARNAEIELLQESLENRELLISNSLETVKANAKLVGEQIAMIAQEHGIIMSDAIISSWKSGENAIAGYGIILSEQTSAFIGNLMGVQSYVYGLQDQANTTANSLAWMFGTRADHLVQQLTSSYYSEANLNAMTNTLQNSLINTLERGYNINGITSALSSIASGADVVASAANRAASALANMGAQQASSIQKGTPKDVKHSGFNSGYKVYDSITDKQIDVVRGSYSDLLKKYDNSARGIRVEKFAKGGIVSKRKDSPLDKIAQAVGEDKLVAVRSDEAVFTADQVEAIRELTPVLGNMNQLWNLSGFGGNSIPEAVSVKQRPNVTLHYDNLININGDVNDTNHFTKQVGNIAEKCINKTFQELSRDLRYGR